MNAIRTLVIDDEPRARERLVELLEAREGFQVVGDCRSGAEAVEALASTTPDLIFLDVQMPGLDGFEVLESTADRSPAVVFVTAYDDYAVRAFDVDAVDYLVKPFDDDRFSLTLERVREHLEGRRSARLRASLAELLEQHDPGSVGDPAETVRKRHLDRILLKDDDRTFFMRVDRIDWIEAAAYYAKIHVADDVFFVRISLNKLEKELDPRSFVRIHRSAIVNIDRIRELRQWVNGAYLVILKDGTELRMSRSRRENVADLFGRSP